MEDSTIYVFVRGDLPEEDQLVQAAHAVFNMSRFAGIPKGNFAGEPRIIVLDGGKSEKAFQKTYRKLCAGMLPARLFAEYKDPDMLEWGVTAIATLPLTKEQSLPLAHYRLRHYSPPAASSAEVVLDDQRGVRLP
ncbi:MAG TPA: hypothetical protein VHA06_17935 [Candidatus Angelobacter sp.]|jgi:hypothetical protein|nr:hypothetical protein [Candidatus Angelobacter sp.]